MATSTKIHPLQSEIDKIENALFLLKDCGEDVKIEQLECIEEAKTDMVSEYDRICSELDEMTDEKEELERSKANEDEGPILSDIPNTSISYECSNFMDTQIMEALANCLHVSSGVTPLEVLNALESLPTSAMFKKVAQTP